ncbi:MAG: gephyrin-like molybdotransferase Glp [Chloroflexota bacterium]
MTELISVNQALLQILSEFDTLPAEPTEISEALYRTLAEDIHSPFDLPLFSNSSVDGFAVCASKDLRAGTRGNFTLPLVGDIPAGMQTPLHLAKGETVRIMTGAPLPEGADAVLPVEDTNYPYRDASAPLPAEVIFYRFPMPGENVRPRGQDVQKGQKLLAKGRKLQPQDIGMLATLGLDRIPVIRKPKIALFSSGDELLMPGIPPQPGKIFDANSYSLGLLARREGAEVIRLGVARDEYQAVLERFEMAKNAGADLILTSAGVSVGAFDFVRQVLEEHGQVKLWRVNMRPGKPLTFGSYEGIPVISLPGNPVSAFVGFLVFVRPVIAKLSGLQPTPPVTLPVILEHPVLSDGRESYLRAIVYKSQEGFIARLTGHQGSGNLYSLVQANALLIIPAGVKSLPAGETVQAWLLDDEPLPVMEKPE